MRALFSRTAIALLYVISYLPLPVMYFFSNILAILLYDVFRVRRSITITNLTRSFPEKEPREIRAIARRYYQHLADMVFEIIKCLTITEAQIRDRCKLENRELINRYDEEKRSVVAVLGHYGNWEWAALISVLNIRQPTVIVYKPLRNPHFDALFRKVRERFGVQMVPMKEVGRYYVRNRSEHFVTCFVSDQPPRQAEVAYWTTFLNQDTAVHFGAEKLAAKYDHAVVFVSMKKVSRGRYVCNLEEIVAEPTRCAESEITETHVRKLEALIREEPEFWLWSHRRWKRKRPVVA